MKNTRKLLGLGLSLCLSLTLLAGCSPAGTTPPAATGTGAPVAPVEGTPAAWTSAKDLEGKKIAVQEGTTGDLLVSDIAGTTVTRFKSGTACAMELLNGRVDCVVIDSLPAQKLVDVNPEKLQLLSFAASEEKEAYAIGVRKDDAGATLATDLNAAMTELKENGTFDLLVQKHISGEDVTLPDLPASDGGKGELKMGTNAEFEPFEYVNDAGELDGFDVDLAKYLCAAAGYTLTIENMDFDSLPAALLSGKIDFIAAGLSVTKERLLSMAFTNDYYEATQSIIVQK